jgi:hypothetical protein
LLDALETAKMDFPKMIDALRQVPIQSQIYSQEARRIIGDIIADNSVAFVGEHFTDTHSYLCAIRYGRGQPELWRLSYAADVSYRYMGEHCADITYSVVSEIYERIATVSEKKKPNDTLADIRIRKYNNELEKLEKDMVLLENDMDKLRILSRALEEKHKAKTLLLRALSGGKN